MYTAKVFQNGSSQAVRLPKGFRFDCKEVSVSHLGRGVLLQPFYETWLDVYNAMSELKEFMEVREDLPPQERGEF